eukprot:scaffold5896_cov155-Amphora_coffeaeformis.AAC.3
MQADEGNSSNRSFGQQSLKDIAERVQNQSNQESKKKQDRDPFLRFSSDMERVLLNEEGRPTEEVYNDARRRFEKPGCCLILKFAIDGEATDDDPMLKLSINMYLRAFLENCAIATDHQSGLERARLIKYDDERAFLFHEKASVALRSACKAHMVARYANEKFKKEKNVEITITIGLEVGDLLLLVGDYYGDAVNVASKLGEDHAEAGQILISVPCHDTIADQDPKLLQMLEIDDGFVKISGVEISYKSISMNNSTAEGFLPRTSIPDEEALKSVNEGLNPFRRLCLGLLDDDPVTNLSTIEALQQERQVACMLQSDMSGFTRLTKKYGILHFLTLVMHCRKIFKDCLPPNDGSIVKYDGDNVIAKFDSAHKCLAAVRAIHAAIDKFNRGREKDFQIRIKLGVSYGEVLIVGHDIMGESWEDCCALGEDAAEVGEVLVTTAVYNALQAGSNGHYRGGPRFAFESRECEMDHGEVLKHYNVTFPKIKPLFEYLDRPATRDEMRFI